jgi:hypothetical protein
MASSLKKLTTINNIAPGESEKRSWNNATPATAVWYIQAIPLEKSFTSETPAVQSVKVEVTEVWRRLNRSMRSAEIPSPDYEHEIWYVIKNVGAREVDVDVYASIIS